MSFKDLLEKYKQGTLSEEERKKVEDEIEKLEAIQDYLEEEERDQDLQIPFEEEKMKEMKDIRKEVRKKKWGLVFLSVSGVIILILVFQFLITPFLNLFFYNPNANDYSDYSNNFAVSMATYTELHNPSKVFDNAVVESTGIGSYKFTLYRWDTFLGNTEVMEGKIGINSISLPENFNVFLPLNYFPKATNLFYYGVKPEELEKTIQKLKKLPEYVHVKAYLSFSEDVSMDRIADMVNWTEDRFLYISWVGVRNSEKDVQNLRYIGFEPTGTGTIYEKINKKYPYYELSPHITNGEIRTEVPYVEEEREESDNQSTVQYKKYTGELYEKHFRDLLQFQIDHNDFLEKLSPDFQYKSYYENTMSYIEKNGVYSYGIVLHGSPKEILDFIQEVDVYSLYVDDLTLTLPEE